MASIFDTLTVDDFKNQFPRFSPQYLSSIEYIEGNTYFLNQIVYFNELFYQCIVESTAELPTVASDWKVINNSVLNYTQDSDILNAYNEAEVNFNESLFKDETMALMVFLYLAAHYLTVDFNNALGNNNVGILTSRSVGSVSEGFTIPQWLTKSSALSVYATTGYGVKYASLIRPYLIGNIYIVRGRTTTA